VNPRVDALQVRQKRLLYRSKQRGWLEVDLLLGSWAAENVGGLSEAEMDQYEAILNMETIDIFNVINGRQDAPPDADNPILARLREYANNSPFGKASAQTYEQVKEKTGLI
jgi:succinate dehydrogenase assembly factor 2